MRASVCVKGVRLRRLWWIVWLLQGEAEVLCWEVRQYLQPQLFWQILWRGWLRWLMRILLRVGEVLEWQVRCCVQAGLFLLQELWQ